ncbi:MarR family transcriptional regulator [Enterocloster bolteae]|jgi:DNA-binding MarR family transcriptional regulator|uniref:MarR family winged helix-turn-helix transcriptional regulator n=1 Tax=Clostridia TaxID=186801 RepID=UPI00189E7B7B|nr:MULTISPECIES: MarR family transcriptional regulator [Clostridia]MCB7090319.1 MarR family transcriptional regulator [Enterocloster bolteae]MCH1936069.1 MarR family transcriptional regulator [Enterocloster sp. OA11]
MDHGKQLSEHFFHIGMLLHRYQTEAYKENGPLGSPYKGQGRILAILKLKPEISHKELSYLLGISTQSMSELLRKLESKGYVKRVPSEQDRRSMNIILTEEGKKAVEQSDGMDSRDAEQLFCCFTEEEQQQFKQFLERLEDEIIRQLDPDHASEYTFEKMKEMHEYILSHGHREPFRHHGEGPLRNGFGRGRRNDSEDSGRRFEHHRR